MIVKLPQTEELFNVGLLGIITLPSSFNLLFTLSQTLNYKGLGQCYSRFRNLSLTVAAKDLL